MHAPLKNYGFYSYWFKLAFPWRPFFYVVNIGLLRLAALPTFPLDRLSRYEH